MRFAEAVFGAFLVALPLWAADADLDGVPDALDRCPGTSFDAPADNEGCPLEGKITLAAGLSWSEGDYGGSEEITSRTRDLWIGYTKGRWNLSAAFSWLDSGVQSPLSGTQESSGAGDTWLSAGYGFYNGEAWSLNGRATLKLPTAGKDAGTGNVDAGVSATLLWIADGFLPFVTAGYLATGDDSDATYDDPLFLSAGAGRGFGSFFAGGSANWSQAQIKGMEDAKSLSLYGIYGFDGGWFASGGYTRGLSDSAAESSVSLMIGAAF